MLRTISSAQTFMMKFVVPVFWISSFGFSIPMLFHPAELYGGRPPPPEAQWLFLALLIGGSLVIFWHCARLMRVAMTDGELRISNYRREIVVPLSDVDAVTENRWASGHPVTVQFVRRTEFGHRIVFLPKSRPFAIFSPHPIIAELRAAAAAAKRGPSRLT